MPVIIKAILFSFLLCLSAAVFGQLCKRLPARSENCTAGNSLIRLVDESRCATNDGPAYLSYGLIYNRTAMMGDPTELTIQRQYRVGIPVMAGYRVGNFHLEGGMFFGANIYRSQRSTWYTPAADANFVGPFNSNINSAISPVLGIGYAVDEVGILNVRYFQQNQVSQQGAIGRMFVGWSFEW